MAYWLTLDPCKFPIGDLSFTFTIDSNNLPFGARAQLLKDFGSFTIGSDRDNEVIYYPNNFEIDIKTEEEFEDWIQILKDLCTVSTYSMIQQDGVYIFRGYVQQSSVKGDMFRKTLSFRCADQILALKDVDPKTNPLNYGTTQKRSLQYIITDILNSYLDIDQVVSLCTYEAKVLGSGVYRTWVNFGVVPYEHYFRNTSNPYDTMLDVLKSIMVTYGSIGYIGTDEKFYMIPRVYQNNSVFDIANTLIKNIELNVMRKMEGLKLYVYTGSPGTYQTYNYGDVSSNPDRVETIRLDQAVGLLPDNVNSASNLFLFNGTTWDTADFNGVRRKKADGSYTNDKSLWRLTGDDTWAAIQKDRVNYRVTLPGQFDNFTKKSKLLSDHNPKQFYRLLQFPNEYLRPRRFKYDLTKNEAEIDLLSM